MLNSEARLRDIKNLVSLFGDEEELPEAHWMPPDYEPSVEYPDQDPGLVLLTVVKPPYRRQIKELLLPDGVDPFYYVRQVQIEALLDTGTAETLHYGPHRLANYVTGDFPVVLGKEYAVTPLAIEDARRTYKTAASKSASVLTQYCEAEEVMERGGDPLAQIEKPKHSFALLVEPESF